MKTKSKTSKTSKKYKYVVDNLPEESWEKNSRVFSELLSNGYKGSLSDFINSLLELQKNGAKYIIINRALNNIDARIFDELEDEQGRKPGEAFYGWGAPVPDIPSGIRDDINTPEFEKGLKELFKRTREYSKKQREELGHYELQKDGSYLLIPKNK